MLMRPKKTLSKPLLMLFIFLYTAFISSFALANPADDSVITAKVKSGLVANSLTHAVQISVETNNGVVYLSGTVDTNTEAATAVQVAEATKNVKDVNTDNLNVSQSNTSTAQDLKDSYITAKVKGLYIRNNLISAKANVPLSITVETKNGVVYLGGNADRSSQVKRAITLAKSVNGVGQVISGIQLNS